MEFLGVGYQEILVVMALMIVVVGPERLPQMAYHIGRAVRKMQRYARAVRDEFSEELGYIEEQYQAVRGDVEDARRDLQQQQQELDQDMREIDRDVKEAAGELESSVPEEMKQEKRGNVVPISSASTARNASTRTGTDRASSSRRTGSTNGTASSRPSTRPSTATNKPAAARKTPASSTRPAASRKDRAAAAGDEKDEGDSSPPLVF